MNTQITFNPIYDRRTEVHRKASESGSRCIKCNHCNLTFELHSYLKVHIELIHKSESVCQDQIKCSLAFNMHFNSSHKEVGTRK